VPQRARQTNHRLTLDDLRDASAVIVTSALLGAVPVRGILA
jgi:branched-subunit amino acid aminotransferase/4-amino-4-deoxychorismate lyase